MRHAAISPEWLNASSRLELTSLLQGKELKVKGSWGTKVTPAAKVPCIFQQSRVSLALQEMVFLKSRWQSDSRLVTFPSRLVLRSLWKLEVSACSAVQLRPPGDVCSPQRTGNSKPRQTLPQSSDFPRPILHHSLWHREEASKGKSTDLWKPRGQGPVGPIPACINEAVRGASVSQPPSATRACTVPGGKPTTVSCPAYSASPEKPTWGPGRHICCSVASLGSSNQCLFAGEWPSSDQVFLLARNVAFTKQQLKATC